MYMVFAVKLSIERIHKSDGLFSGLSTARWEMVFLDKSKILNFLILGIGEGIIDKLFCERFNSVRCCTLETSLHNDEKKFRDKSSDVNATIREIDEGSADRLFDDKLKVRRTLRQPKSLGSWLILLPLKFIVVK